MIDFLRESQLNIGVACVIGMSLGLGLGGIVTAITGTENWLWIGGSVGFIVLGVGYSLILGWGEETTHEEA